MKEVKIIGLNLNHQLGIIKATKLTFDENNRLIVFKGGVGQGKSTLKTGIELGTKGSKTLIDKQLYGEIDTEVQLLDGTLSLWVGCKTANSGLIYTLYTKDNEGNIIKDPVIDGVKATPAKYLETLQTELTWRMDELTSENPSVQKKILLKLYQEGLKQHGIIFDKMHPGYKDSILGKIDAAVKNRDEKDTIRKMKGGIADDLKAKGHDPDRPETCPDFIDIGAIDQQIKAKEKEKTQKETNSEAVREKELAEIRAKAQETINECLNWNKLVKDDYDSKFKDYSAYTEHIKYYVDNLANLMKALENLGIRNEYDRLKELIKYPDEVDEPIQPTYIILNEQNQVDSSNIESLPDDAKELVNRVLSLRKKYTIKAGEPKEFDSTEIDGQIQQLELSKRSAIENNKIADAIDAFHMWRKANAEVAKLQNEYLKLLQKVDTGVEGLKMVAIDNDIFLMYDGSYDPEYFGNSNKELRKLSSYSGTQKPVICLLIQNYLLSKKPKAMRYMFIDNIPIDKKTRNLIESMCDDLNLRVFLNITGDFEKSKLTKGEILIEGGEVFFV